MGYNLAKFNMKKVFFTIALFICASIGVILLNSFREPNNNRIEITSTRSVNVYYNFVKVGATGVWSKEITSGEYNPDNNTIIIKGETCDVKECSYYKMRMQGLEVDDPRANFQYQAWSNKLRQTVYFE